MSLVKPIRVGPVTIEAPVILAPMTGVTDLPFRKIVRRYGAGLTVSEMIASQAMIRETRQSLQKAAWDPVEDPVGLGRVPAGRDHPGGDCFVREGPSLVVPGCLLVVVNPGHGPMLSCRALAGPSPPRLPIGRRRPPK